MIVAWLAAVAQLTGAGCVYLASPHQAALMSPVNARPLRFAGTAALLASLALLLAQMGPATAVFTWTISLMLLWSVPPIVIRWLRFRKEKIG